MQHPGTYMSPEMTFNLRTRASKSSYARLLQQVSLGYIPKALPIVDIGWNGKGVGHMECTKDGETAIVAALLHWILPASGARGYAKVALQILESWAKTNKVWKGNNALLEASWSVCAMARSAELLKYSKDAEVAAQWKTIEPLFFGWLDTVIMPVLKKNDIWGWKPIGNWHFSQICARMQIAILRNDPVDWKWCIDMFPIALEKTLSQSWSKERKNLQKGEIAESVRDLSHAQFCIGGITQAMEMAYHQGVNLYDHPIARTLPDVLELHARLMLQEVPAGFTKEDIHVPYGYWPEPVWHIGYYHYTVRKKMELPKLKEFLQKLGPDRATFHWGPNELTHSN